MGTAEICLLIMALYTLVLLIIAAQYSTRTIETLGDLVHQLIEKIDAHNETILKDVRSLISAITGQPELSDDKSEDRSDGKKDTDTSDVESDMQYLYENYGRPTMWTSIKKTYEPVDDSKDNTEVSKTTVINPYDEHSKTKAS